MLDFGLLESERKVYKGCVGSKFCTKLGIKNDTKGITVTHCRLALLEVLNIKVPAACVVGPKLFAVHLIFDCRGSRPSHLQQVMEVKTCVFHSFDSLIAYFRLLCGGKSFR